MMLVEFTAMLVRLNSFSWWISCTLSGRRNKNWIKKRVVKEGKSMKKWWHVEATVDGKQYSLKQEKKTELVNLLLIWVQLWWNVG